MWSVKILYRLDELEDCRDRYSRLTMDYDRISLHLSQFYFALTMIPPLGIIIIT
jgi:hypothetical protein